MSQRHKKHSTTSSICSSLEESESGSEELEDIEATVLEEPMYYILARYLETENGKNIATVLEELVQELRAVRLAIQSTKTSSSS